MIGRCSGTAIKPRSGCGSSASGSRWRSGTLKGNGSEKTIVGLETLLAYVKHHPKAQAAFNTLAEQVRHPFDPTEQNLGRDGAGSDFDPTESD